MESRKYKCKSVPEIYKILRARVENLCFKVNYTIEVQGQKEEFMVVMQGVCQLFYKKIQYQG